MGLRTFLKKIDWAYRHGFKKSTVQLCGINKHNYREYVSDRYFRSRHPLNKVYSSIIDNKLYLPYLFKDYPDYIPEFLYFKDKYGFMSLKFPASSTRISSEAFLIEMSSLKKVVLKSICGEVGKGFLLLEYIDDECFMLNNKKIGFSELICVMDSLKDYIVQDYVEQHHLISAINSSSLNTLRVLMVWNPDKNSFVIGPCFQRFGCNGNVVDNLGSGNGLLVFVDSKTGRYRNYGMLNVNGEGERFVNDVTHPDTGYAFKDKSVHNFAFISEKLVEIMNSVSFLSFVALDIAITDDGFKIIETNSYPDPAIAQLEGGWLKDPDMSSFFNNGIR